jgi:hypothetical protein
MDSYGQCLILTDCSAVHVGGSCDHREQSRRGSDHRNQQVVRSSLIEGVEVSSDVRDVHFKLLREVWLVLGICRYTQPDDRSIQSDCDSLLRIVGGQPTLYI